MNLPLPLLTTIVILLVIPTCYCQQPSRYAICGDPVQCGNLDRIVYPFWGGDRPDYCGGGHSAFQLNCDGEFPVITIRGISYRVLDLVEMNRTLTLARDDLVDDNCPSIFFDTTFDLNLFGSVSTNLNVSLHYGCTTVMGQTTPLSLFPNQFNCPGVLRPTLSYFVMEVGQNRNIETLVTCTENISVPVNRESGTRLARAEATASDLETALNTGFPVQWTADATLCTDCVNSGGRCGSVTGSNSFTCFCTDGLINTTRCPAASSVSSTTPSSFIMRLIIGFLAGGSTISLIILTAIICYRKRQAPVLMAMKKKQVSNKDVEAFLTIHGSLSPKRYSYSDIKRMTNSFAEKLGEGGYGSVFKGKLLDGRFVAVKVLTNDANTSDGGDFVNEVASISRTSHVNIVTLLGFCLERNKRALIYEFMPNKSLDKFIHKSVESSFSLDSETLYKIALFSLDSETLYKIAVGTARGLEYLHRGCNTRIVHFDIKPENILLDEDFCPKISDFGLSKLCQRKNSVVSMIGARGTPGYIAPEVFSRTFGEVSHKSDVYSYGMMVINMVGAGDKNEVKIGLDSTESDMYFPEFIYKRLELGENLSGIMSEEGQDEEMTKKMVLVSLWCIQTNPLDRPSMGKVVDMLEGDIDSIQIPPKLIVFPRAVVNQDSCSPISSSRGIEILET